MWFPHLIFLPVSYGVFWIKQYACAFGTSAQRTDEWNVSIPCAMHNSISHSIQKIFTSVLRNETGTVYLCERKDHRMEKEFVYDILDTVGHVLQKHHIQICLPEDREEFEESKASEGDQASIYGSIYYALENALLQLEPDKDKKNIEIKATKGTPSKPTQKVLVESFSDFVEGVLYETDGWYLEEQEGTYYTDKELVLENQFLYNDVPLKYVLGVYDLDESLGDILEKAEAKCKDPVLLMTTGMNRVFNEYARINGPLSAEDRNELVRIVYDAKNELLEKVQGIILADKNIVYPKNDSFIDR